MKSLVCSSRSACLPLMAVALILPRLPTAEEASALAWALQVDAKASSLRQDKDFVRHLTWGSPVERELLGGASHSYQIAVPPGQSARVLIDKEDFNLVVQLFGSNNQKLAEFNGWRYGPIEILLISDTSDPFRVEVVSFEDHQATRPYTIRLVKAAPAVDRRTEALIAQRAFAEGEKLCAEWREASFREAIGKYEQARRLWRKLGDKSQEAKAVKCIGEVHSTLSEYPRALHCFNEALALNQSDRHHLGEVEEVNNLAAVYVAMAEYKPALKHGEEAQHLSQVIGDRLGEARALNNLGDVHYYLSGPETAIDYYNRALLLWQTIRDRRGWARTLLNLGSSYFDLREMDKALQYYNRSLKLSETALDCQGEALALTSIGQAHAYLGERQMALDYHNKALRLLAKIGDQAGQVLTLNNLGSLYEKLGDQGRALSCYEQALHLGRIIGVRQRVKITLNTLGRLYHSLGDNQKALKYFNQVFALSRSADYRMTEALALNWIGMVHSSLGHRRMALEHYNRALPLFRKIKDPFGEAYVLNNIGYLLYLSGQKQVALKYFNRALPLVRGLEDPRAGETLTLQHIARVEGDLGNLIEARSRLEAALNIIESLRAKLVNQDLRASYFATVRQHYELYIDLLLRLHQQHPGNGLDALALQASERARARSLLDMLGEVGADIRQGVAQSLLESERTLRQQLDVKEQSWMRLRRGQYTADRVAGAERELTELLAHYQEIELQIRARQPRYAALTQPQLLDLKDIQRQVLDEDTLLLEYALGDDRSYLWAITPSTIKSYNLPKRAAIEAAARELYNLMARRLEPAAIGRMELYAAVVSQMLLGPVAAQLVKKRLLIVSDGALQYIPFAALPVPRVGGSLYVISGKGRGNGQRTSHEYRPLIVDHEVVSLPSASVLAELRRELAGRVPAEKAIAVLADPVFEKDDPRVKAANTPQRAKASQQALDLDLTRALRSVRLARGPLYLPRLESTRREAEAILAAAPGGDSMAAVDFKASRETVMRADLSQYRIVHFATHGLLNNEHPELSGIVMSLFDEQGRPQNGFLRLHDIYNLNLHADLVVLSACNTALGKDIKGEGIVGLTRGFMYAGAARVIATLWKVGDDATAELMKRFYEKMLKEGQRPAAALRAAQVDMWNWKRWKAPYNWAAFVLQGEWK